MLSTEVLFGFQLQSTFREGFAHRAAGIRRASFARKIKTDAKGGMGGVAGSTGLFGT
jgi:hypothetical protein